MDQTLAQIAAALRGLLAQISPQVADIASGLPDVAVVGGAVGAAIFVLIILFSVIGAMFRPKTKSKNKVREEAPPVRAARPAPAAPQRAAAPPPPQRAATPPSKRAPDPVQKIQRDAESGVARVKQDTERLAETLLALREKAVQAGVSFAMETPTRAFHNLAQALTASDAPALSAARRRIASGDLDGARTDLRRQAQENGGRDGAWRNLATLESLRDLQATVAALEQARAVDPKDFVTLVMLRRLYGGTNQPQQALDVANAATAAAADDRERAIALDELGIACAHMKDGAGARKAMTESLEIVERLAARAPNDAERQRDVAVGHYKIASLGGPDSRDRLIASIAAFDRLSAVSALAPADAEAVTKLKGILADIDKENAVKK